MEVHIASIFRVELSQDEDASVYIGSMAIVNCYEWKKETSVGTEDKIRSESGKGG